MLLYRLKIAVIFICFGVAVIFHFNYGIKGAVYLYLASFLLLMTHFLFGTVHLALEVLKKRDFLQGELLLLKNKHPNWLIRKNRAYYHFAYGIISLQNKDLDKGKMHFEEAAKIGLRSEKDKAFAYLNLAHIAFVQKNLSQAHAHLKFAKNIQTNDLIIKENLQNLESALAKLK